MRVIRKGDTGEEVKTLQRAIGVNDDGVFGPVTDKALRDWQRGHGLFADGVAGPKTWAALERKDDTLHLKRSARHIDKLIVHCSATPEGREVKRSEIDAWHRKRGFNGIGYHYLVHLDGSIEDGRDVDQAGAHTAGYNAHSIGICYIGGVAADGKTPMDTRTEAQKKALVSLLKSLRALYPQATIHGHREFANKACPSFDAKTEYKDLQP
jgi:N-acetylmuramoyl-L-alanine amidase